MKSLPFLHFLSLLHIAKRSVNKEYFWNEVASFVAFDSYKITEMDVAEEFRYLKCFATGKKVTKQKWLQPNPLTADQSMAAVSKIKYGESDLSL